MRKMFFSLIVMLVVMACLCSHSLLAIGESDDFIKVNDVIKVDLDNEALFQSYTEKLFYGVSAKKRSAARNNLNDQQRVSYDRLHSLIERVASGDETMTEKTYQGEIYGDYTSEHCDAETLKVASLMENEDVTKEAKAALEERLKADMTAVIMSLVSDCPYDLYWAQGEFIWSVEMACHSDGQYGWYTIESLKMGITVNEFYRSGSHNYKLNSTKTKAATKALAKAEEIINKAQNLTDVEKLRTYQKQILALSDYNEEAADDQDAHHLNNNPWQMIYLFDGNPDTKVVCAGYTKAFQYLCDQTSFQNKAIYALSVTGTLTYDAEARPHAWNLVHMDDGMNYLIDLTNTQDDSLFLRGAKGSVKEGYTLEANGMEMTYTYHQKETIAIYQTSELSLSADDYQHAEHSHVYGDPVVIRQPSYGVEGLKQMTCEICGGTKTEVIPALDLIDLNSDEVEITMKSEQTYTGEALKPKPVLKCQGKTLKLNAHYSLSYKDNTNVGLAILTIKGLDIYRGKVVKTFKINPKPTAITKVTAGKKRFTVKWKKQTKQTTGYQIQYSLNSSFTDHQSKLIKKNKTVSQTIKKLKGKKKYYVRIRTYKKIGSTYYYSSFSQTKSIKTK